MSRLGNLRDENDPTTTYEGDNNVIQQQTSSYLLAMYNQILAGLQKIFSLFTAVMQENYNSGYHKVDITIPICKQCTPD